MGGVLKVLSRHAPGRKEAKEDGGAADPRCERGPRGLSGAPVLVRTVRDRW